MSQKGQVVLPASLRTQLDLHPGDDFEIFLEDDGTIMLRRISQPPNSGLIEHLLSSPGELEIPERFRDFSSTPDFNH
ncbi:MAG: AbrB/MazE/SpoVT family DNA-binding domain-containing protein [Chthoniobacterales bacterium]